MYFDVEELSRIWLFANAGWYCLLFFQATHITLPLQVSHKLPQRKEITQKYRLSLGGISVWFASLELVLGSAPGNKKQLKNTIVLISSLLSENP